MSREYDVMILIRTNRESCVFSVSELAEWLKQEAEEITDTAAYGRAMRLIKRLPVELLGGKVYRLLVTPEEVKEETTKKAVKKEKTDHFSICKEVLEYLNQKTGKNYKGKAADILKIKARIAPPESHTLEDFKMVIDKKCSEWLGTEWEKFLRPETLFSNKFESYLNQSGAMKKQGKAEQMASYDFSKYIKGD